MTYTTAVTIWNSLRQRFASMAEGLSEDELDLQLGKSSIRSLLQHTAEVEFMFAEWYFDKKKPEEVHAAHTLPELLQVLAASDHHLKEAMEQLDENKWNKPVESPMGPPASTPLEAIGRLMYHAGIHSGQIALIRKQS